MKITRLSLFIFIIIANLNHLKADIITSDTTQDLSFTSVSVPTATSGNLHNVFSYDPVTEIQNNAVYTINMTASGVGNGTTSIFFIGSNFSGGRAKPYPAYQKTFLGGTLRLYYDGVNLKGTPLGLFLGRDATSGNAQPLTFDSNLYITMAPNSNMGFAVFFGAGNPTAHSGSLYLNKNVFIDANNAIPWQNSATKKYVRLIFYYENNGNVYVNYNPTTNQTLNPDNIVQLKGDVAFPDTVNVGNTSVYINLSNPESFFMGNTSIAKNNPALNNYANITLENGGKWYVTDSSIVDKLNISNENLDSSVRIDTLKEANTSIVDLYKYASSNVNGVYCTDGNCPRYETPYSPRTLKANSISGENGVFRLMSDLTSGRTDRIDTGSLNALEFIQIYQNPSNILLNPPNSNMVVASANTLNGDGDFQGISTIIGIYDYLPHLDKRTSASGATQWVLNSIERTPNQTAKSLFNILSLPYQIFRIQSDNLYLRFEDFTYPSALNGLWAKSYGGGIYKKQSYGGKTPQNLFYGFEGGYDYGESSEMQRYFYGGSLSYTHLNTSDPGFEGNAKAIGFGVYSGYVEQEGWVLNGILRYIYSPMDLKMYQAPDALKLNENMLLLGLRAGYRIYPFWQERYRTGEQCIQGKFCRNIQVKTKIKDPSMYFEPYISLNSGVIFGDHFSFRDKSSQSLIESKLDVSPTLITTIGLKALKRFDYTYGALNIKGLVEYAMDLNLGGKITLIDGANVPLYEDSGLNHRLALGAGIEWLSFWDTLKLYADFKTDFLGRLNTYWLLSGGIAWQFGQKAQKIRSQLNYRPLPKRTHKSAPKPYLKPFKPAKKENEDTFYEQNHFKKFPDPQSNFKKQENTSTQAQPKPISPPKPRTINSWTSQRPLRQAPPLQKASP